MTLKEIRDECRAIARDVALVDEDLLWSDEEMDRIINRVYYEIARRTKCIYDATTTSVCLISSNPVDHTTYSAGTLDYIWANDPDSWLYQKNVAPYLYILDPSILHIEEIKWTKRQWKLTEVSVVKWQTNPWWEQVIGMPTEYALDLESGKIALNFRSEQSDTLRLAVKRLPLVNLSEDADTPEFKEEYHLLMQNGVLYYMYSKQDADTIDEAKLDDYKAKYELDIDEIKHREAANKPKLTVNYSMGAFR